VTIQEAIRSGKAFKRKGWDLWITPKYAKDNSYLANDILADDWEIEREPREIYGVEINGNIANTLIFNTKEEAFEYLPAKGCKAIKFREVIE
jgi:hypothetical protein